MSSILKALRKLEEQQAARRGETPHVTLRPAPSGPRWRAPTAILVSVVLAVAATVAVMNGISPRTAPEPAPQASPHRGPAPEGVAGAQPTVPATEEVTVPTAVPDREVEGGEPIPADETGPVRMAVPRSAVPRRAQAVPPMPALEEPETTAPLAAIPRGSREARLKQASPRTLPKTQTMDRALAPPPPSQPLTVSGIAWQKGESDRIAMVNGSPVTEGTVVAGARVVEIKRDRVRFSRDGAEFEIPIGTGGDR